MRESRAADPETLEHVDVAGSRRESRVLDAASLLMNSPCRSPGPPLVIRAMPLGAVKIQRRRAAARQCGSCERSRSSPSDPVGRLSNARLLFLPVSWRGVCEREESASPTVKST